MWLAAFSVGVDVLLGHRRGGLYNALGAASDNALFLAIGVIGGLVLFRVLRWFRCWAEVVVASTRG